MDNFFYNAFIIFSLLLCQNSYSTTITTIANGDWTNPAVWSSGNVPIANDSIIIHHRIGINVDIFLDHNYLYVAMDGVLCGHHDLNVYQDSYAINYGKIYLERVYISGDTMINHGSMKLVLLLHADSFHADYFSNGSLLVGTDFTCDPPVPDFTTDKIVICRNDCIGFRDLSSNNPTSWKWTFQSANPEISYDQNPINICYPDTGLFSVELIAGNEMGNDTIRKLQYVRVLPAPVQQTNFLGNDTVLCPNEIYTLQLSIPGVSYLWKDGSTNPDYTITSEGSYEVTVYNNLNCFVSDTINVKAISIPEVNLGPDRFLCEGETILLKGPYANSSTYLWQNNAITPVFEVTKAGVYWEKVKNKCGYSTDTIEIIQPYIFIPNLITPNDDGQNDQLILETNLSNVLLEIYNRWGERTYKANSYQNEWNGTGLSDGIYYYYINKKDVCNIEKKGWLEILR